jgi:hypothetical protein
MATSHHDKAEPPHSLSGRVTTVGNTNHQPLRNTKIQAVSGDFVASTFTDCYGSFCIPNLAPGEYCLTVGTPGNGFQWAIQGGNCFHAGDTNVCIRVTMLFDRMDESQEKEKKKEQANIPHQEKPDSEKVEAELVQICWI